MSNLERVKEKILSRDEAQNLLNPYFEDICKVVESGLVKYRKVPAGVRSEWKPRTHACALNDHIVHEAIAQFEGVHGIAINEEYETTVFVIDDLAALRFKKIKSNGRPSSYPTDRQIRITQQLEIEGIAKATYVDIQYLPNDLYTEISSVSIACYRGDRLWEIPIAGEIGGYLPMDEHMHPVRGPIVTSTRTKREASTDAS